MHRICHRKKNHRENRDLGPGQEHAGANAGDQFIPVTTSTCEHTSSMKVLMKFDDVVVQGLEQRFVDMNNMIPSISLLHLGFQS